MKKKVDRGSKRFLERDEFFDHDFANYYGVRESLYPQKFFPQSLSSTKHNLYLLVLRFSERIDIRIP